MQRQCRIQKGLYQVLEYGEQGRITLAVQFTNKVGAGCWYDFCSRSHLCKGLECPRVRLCLYGASYQVRGINLTVVSRYTSYSKPTRLT
jgi:hypothetical protein